MPIDNPRLPLTLLELIDNGVWPRGKLDDVTNAQEFNSIIHPDKVKFISRDDFKIILMPPPFRSLKVELDHWEGFWDSYDKSSPSIDIDNAYVIADFGIGSDSPIVLLLENGKDAGIYYLHYKSRGDRVLTSWKKTCDSFQEFAITVGLLGNASG